MTDHPYLQRLRIKNYGCVQDCELKLTRLHALVGANDSGKSTLLRGLGLAQRMFDVQQLLGPAPSNAAFELDWSDGLTARR
ncbi:MAG TPA: AAA family ATPase, partial [Nannocystis sp.]